MTFVTALFRALFFFTYVPPYDCTALYSSTDTLLASPQLTSPPIAALFSLIALSVIPTNHLTPFPITSHPPQPHTIHTLHLPVSIKMAACTHVHAAHCYQHCATLYTKRHGGTDILLRGGPYTYIYRKTHFQKFFWALSRGPGGYCPSFSNSPTHAAYPRIFSDVSTFIFASFFTALPSIYFLV